MKISTSNTASPLPIRYTKNHTVGSGVRYAHTSCDWKTYHASWTRFPLSKREPIRSVASGEVTRTEHSSTGGHMIEIVHYATETVHTRYLHLHRPTCVLEKHLEGTTHWFMRFNRVDRLDHLHFEVRVSKIPFPFGTEGSMKRGNGMCCMAIREPFILNLMQDSSSSPTVLATNNSSSCSLATVLGASAIKS